MPKAFLATGTPSTDDIQAHGIVKVPLIVARYHNSPLLYEKVGELVSILQVNAVPRRASYTLAYILQYLLNNEYRNESLESILRKLLQVTIPLSEIDLKYIQFILDDDMIMRMMNLKMELMRLANSIEESIDARRGTKIMNIIVMKFFENDTINATIEMVKNELHEDEREALEKAMAASASTSKSKSYLKKGGDEYKVQEVLKMFGLSCSLPSAFIGALYIARKYWYSLEEALEQNALSGGDNCARAMIIGSILGVMRGTVIVPSLIEGMSATLRDSVVKKSLETCHFS